jgi:hypothetical protein
MGSLFYTHTTHPYKKSPPPEERTKSLFFADIATADAAAANQCSPFKKASAWNKNQIIIKLLKKLISIDCDDRATMNAFSMNRDEKPLDIIII